MTRPKDDLTFDQVNELIIYDPITGIFTHKNHPRLVNHQYLVGAVAGSLNKKTGYWRLWIKGKSYAAARIAWLLHYGVWPEGEVDHGDLDPLNYRILNLRDSHHGQNIANIAIRSDNTSGFKGVLKSGNRYRADICHMGVRKYLGTRDTAEEAYELYVAAARELHGEFAQI